MSSYSINDVQFPQQLVPCEYDILNQYMTTEVYLQYIVLFWQLHTERSIVQGYVSIIDVSQKIPDRESVFCYNSVLVKKMGYD